MISKIRILYIDDYELDRELVKDALEKEHGGFELTEASNKKEFEFMLNNHEFDVVLSDFNIAGYEGLEVLEAVRAYDPRIPVIIVTGTGSEEIAVMALKQGASDYVIKRPKHIRKLPQTIIAAIEKQTSNDDRRKTETALIESEERFRNISENSLVGIYMIQDDIFIYVNLKFAEIFGYSVQECLNNMHFRQLVHPEDLDTAQEQIRKRVSGEPKSLQYTCRGIKKGGDIIHVEIFGSSLHLNGKTCATGTLLDSTDRKLAEEALRNSEKRYRSLFNSIRDALLVADTNRTIIDCNQAFKDLFGYSREEILGKQTLFVYENEEDFKQTGTTIKDHMGDASFIYTVHYKKEDGSVFPGETKVFFLKNDDGTIIGFISLIRDVTEVRRAEAEREKLQAQLNQAQKMESVGRLAGGVAHDYNNMLSVILGFSGLALDKVDPADPLHDDLEEIIKAGQRATEITRQLLAFARKQIVAPVVLDLNTAVEGMLKMLRPLIGEDIALCWTPETHLWPVKIDPSQLDQILANLCVNARDAIADVGKITIETQAVTFDEAYCSDHPGFVPGNFVVLAVSDDGCGIDKDKLENIFEPFFTTKGVDKGTGLGLSTVYGIIKQNNGFINVYSEPGKGTAFRIYLPRHAAVTTGGAKEKEVPTPKGKGETVLVVEDNEPILKLADRMLQGLGYTVLTANTVDDALGLAQKHAGKIQLLITDVVMPEMNGRELANQMLALRPDLKTLFMSGYTSDIILQRNVIDDDVNFIQKPFSKQALATAIRKVLGE